MHFVAAALQPVEEALHAVPVFAIPVALTFEYPALVFGGQFFPWHIGWYFTLRGKFDQVFLADLIGLGLPGLDGATSQR